MTSGMRPKLRIVFMGTPEFAVPALEALVAAGHDVVAAYSQPPRPGGRRGRELVASPVQRRAEELGIAVRHPVSLRNAEAQAEFAGWQADVAVVAAYGLILPQAVLDAPRHGCINIHASLLPRWRGAAPIQRAILAGDEVTGVTIMQMEAGLDTGPMLAAVETPVANKTAGELTAELAAAGAALTVQVLHRLGDYPPKDQPDTGITYAAKLTKDEARLDFTQSAESVLRQVQAFNPPGAYFEHAGERIRLLAAVPVVHDGSPGEVFGDGLSIACAAGAIRATVVQRAGRGVMTADDLLRGFPIPAGTVLG